MTLVVEGSLVGLAGTSTLGSLCITVSLNSRPATSLTRVTVLGLGLVDMELLIGIPLNGFPI